MRTIVRGSQFQRDVKTASRQGKDVEKLRNLILLLAEGSPLPPQCKDHALRGEWQRFRDCHIEPDWLLLDKIDEEELYLVRTGSHSDLF